MREIIFRGKRVDNGEWVEGYFCKKYFQEPPHERSVIQYKTERDSKMWKPDYMAEEIIPESISEFTGLTDKNGNKIFEGDICQDEHSVVLVLWQSHKWCCKVLKGCVLSRGCAFPLWQWDNCPENGNRQLEVIGNIHDNPELLKGGD
jgi:uncharacterized phage protein (TIGR01671 family)